MAHATVEDRTGKSDRIEHLQNEIAEALGYDIVHHRLELYGRKRKAS